jgi:hypothetical protein
MLNNVAVVRDTLLDLTDNKVFAIIDGLGDSMQNLSPTTVARRKKKYSAKYHRDQRAKRLLANPEKQKEAEAKQFSDFYLTAKGRAAHMLNNARSRARKYKVPCDLTRAWIQERLECGACEITGIPFVLCMNGGKGHVDNPFTPSLDRKKRQEGYTKENVQVVSWIYNRARGAFSDEAFNQMLDALIQKRKDKLNGATLGR